jgi:hypothetical protein
MRVSRPPGGAPSPEASTSARWRQIIRTRFWPSGLTNADLDRYNYSGYLEKNEYIRREPDPNDRRCSIVLLTAIGRGLPEKLTPLVLDYLEKCFRGLAAEDLAQLRAWHETIVANLESLPRD